MKKVSDIAKSFLPVKSDPVLVEYIAVIGGCRKIDPILSSEVKCTACDGSGCYTPLMDLEKEGMKRLWICANRFCLTTSKENMLKATMVPPTPRRAMEWALFCEINGIGDEYHDVEFENVKQSETKISYMLKFATTPRGIILMEGDPGTGKTYASLAMCEFYTRRDSSCIFSTQKNMAKKWLETFNDHHFNNYIDKITTCCLLVIDDFGIVEATPQFISFFMDLINTRMQWKNRGTVITTNLKIDVFNKFCGEALSDRILTGKRFEFKGKTRRTETII